MEEKRRAHRRHRTIEEQEYYLREYHNLGLTKKEFSRIIGIGHNTLSRWEKKYEERQRMEQMEQDRYNFEEENTKSEEYISIPVEQFQKLIEIKTKMDIMLSVMRA